MDLEEVGRGWHSFLPFLFFFFHFSGEIPVSLFCPPFFVCDVHNHSSLGGRVERVVSKDEVFFN